jgi:hypothetical protein
VRERSPRGRAVKIGDSLEHALLGAVLAGRADKSVVKPEELSKTGRVILEAIRSVEKPTYHQVLLHAVEVQGYPRDGVTDYLSQLKRTSVDTDPGEILTAVRDKQILNDVVSSAVEMLGESHIDLGLLAGLLERDIVGGAAGFDSVAERVKLGFPEPPNGFRLRSLPALTTATGGIYGTWAVGGEPAMGKSALAWQIALDASGENNIPSIYYDLENSFAVFMDRTRQIYRGDLDRARKATSRIFYRDSIRTLEADLARVPAPALVVVDHLQRLPSSLEFRKASLDSWVHRLDALKKRGYTVLLVSEVGRQHYNSEASISSYKESGEIEYSVDTGLQLIPGPARAVEVHVVKNRHREHVGLTSILTRVNNWAFKETGVDYEQPERIIS